MLRTRPWLLFLVALVLAGACRCEDPGLGTARGDFRPQETEVDFGRVLEGTQATRTVTLLGTGRAGVTVTARASPPFSVVEDTVSVSGGGSAALQVVFTAGDGPAEGTLELTAGSRAESVVLRGLGVRPPMCVPSGQCLESRYELESDMCVESPKPNGTLCVPTSLCQEQGRCQDGECAGQARLCDDDDPCTVDSCSPTEGCVTEPVVCPQPANPCRVGVCQRERGCVEADAADFSICGPVDCRTADVCFSGTCRTVPTPDGTLCSPPTPCQGEGRCQSGECQRPDAGELMPTFSQSLGGVPVAEDGGPVLLSYGGALFTSVCAEDAGCRLVSYTENGLLRFEAPYADGGVRTLLAVSDAGVLMREPEALEGYARTIPGERLWQAPLRAWRPPGAPEEPSTGVGRVAVTAEGEVVSLISWRARADAGVELDGGVDAGLPEALATLVILGSDGGVRRAGMLEGFAGEDSRVALDEQGLVLLCEQGGGHVARAEPRDEDAGTGFVTVPLLDVDREGGASLAVAGGRLFAGTRRFASTDGGNLAQVSWDAGTQYQVPLDEPALLLGDVGYAFARTCPDGGPCATEQERLVLRALDARTGMTAWESPALPLDAPGTLHEASLLSGGAVGALASVSVEGRTLSYLQLLTPRGQLVCPLSGTPRIAGASHVGRILYVVLEREGVWRLEAFDLGPDGLAETRGWPQRHGVQGTRRARP